MCRSTSVSSRRLWSGSADGRNYRSVPYLVGSSNRELPVSQSLEAPGGEKAVAVEQLVDLPSAVALTSPKRTKHWPVACDRDGPGELFGSRGIEGDGESVVHLHGPGESGDVEHLNDIDGNWRKCVRVQGLGRGGAVPAGGAQGARRWP